MDLNKTIFTMLRTFKMRVKLFIASFAMFIYLTGCAQVPVFSYVTLQISNAETIKIKEVEVILLAKAQDLGGSCEWTNKIYNTYYCTGFNYGKLSDMISGFNRLGEFRIGVESLEVTWFPLKKKVLESGDYLPKGHSELEKWLLNTFEEFGVIQTKRLYMGTGFKVDLL